MKLFLTALMIMTASLTALAQKLVHDPHAELRKVNGSYHGIMISGGFDLYLSEGEETVAVSASSAELRNQIKAVVEDGILKIYLDGSGLKIFFNMSSGKLKAYVSYRTLSSIAASGGCDVMVDGTLKTPRLKISVSGGCDFDGRVDVNELEVKQSGGTDVKISGKATIAKIDASGGSDFDGYQLMTEACEVEASGASDINISVSKELTASASGASDINYRGSPVLKKTSSSGASNIRQSR